MTFGQLIEYNLRNTFLEKSYTKCAREPSPGFLEFGHISRSTGYVIQFLFIVSPSGGLAKQFKTKVLTTCFDLTLGFFKKITTGLELVS